MIKLPRLLALLFNTVRPSTMNSTRADLFEKAVAHLLAHEGGYSDHPSDPGGETNYGITLETYNQHLQMHGRATVEPTAMRELSKDEAKAIYKKLFWLPLRADELPPPQAVAVFDFAVNAGVSRAVKIYQRVLSAAPYDGIIGPITIDAARDANSEVVLDEYLAQRIAFYAGLDHSEDFMLGWTRRAVSMHSLAKTV